MSTLNPQSIATIAATVPEYKCIKDVRAFKIKRIEQVTAPSPETDPTWAIMPVDTDLSIFIVDHNWFLKHNPQVGDYVVFYKDGYVSVSPAKAFEEGYNLKV